MDSSTKETEQRKMNIKLIEDANGSDVKWFDVDGATYGVALDGGILCGDDGTRMGEDWENQNWELVEKLK